MEHVVVGIGDTYGVDPSDVEAELRSFEERLQAAVEMLDRRVAEVGPPSGDDLKMILVNELGAQRMGANSPFCEWQRTDSATMGQLDSNALWPGSICSAKAAARRHGLRRSRRRGNGGAV